MTYFLGVGFELVDQWYRRIEHQVSSQIKGGKKRLFFKPMVRDMMTEDHTKVHPYQRARISLGIQQSLGKESHLHLQINVIPIRVEMELTLGPNSTTARPRLTVSTLRENLSWYRSTCQEEQLLYYRSLTSANLQGDVPFLFCRSRQKRRLADRSAADSQGKSCRVPSDKKVDRAHGGKLVFGNQTLEKAIIESHFPPCNSQL